MTSSFSFSVVVEVLHRGLLETDGLELEAGVHRVGKHAAVADVAHLHAHERAALARLDVLEFDDLALLAVVDDAHAVLEIGGGDGCHGLFPSYTPGARLEDLHSAKSSYPAGFTALNYNQFVG